MTAASSRAFGSAAMCPSCTNPCTIWYMGQQRIDVRVRADASPAALYALLRDGASWPVWSPIGSFELRSPAADEPEGVGAVPVFRPGKGARGRGGARIGAGR